ncbi:hypothetical protein B566_EDAN003708 [Ephemera danica]|nr:hypothetical protein B566_EDAN003708 [Ephemera danica]
MSIMSGMHRAAGITTSCSDESTFNSLECWDYSVEIELAKGAQDLQLAAELGKTLLERNKELENTLRQQQALVDDQTQEIEYLTKQTAALREVNDSRLRIYEQLEVSIQELERNNQRLAVENAADKKQIKSLCHSLDAMEARCEELTRALEEAQTAERRRQRGREGPEQSSEHPNNKENEPATAQDDQQEALAAQIAMLKAQKDRETRRAEEIEEQLTSLIQENAALEEQMSSFKMREEQLRSLEEEISSMQGHQMCFRCMRRFGGGTGASTATPSLMDEDLSSSMMEDESCLDEETDLETEVQSIASETHNTVLSDNPYRVLVEKYEALLSMQRRPATRRPPGKCASPAPGLMLGRLCSSPLPPNSLMQENCMSLQEELQLSGEFNSGPVSLMLDDFSKVEEGEPRESQLKLQQVGPGQLYFSEAETNSSSGVSEGDLLPRSQHRATQTDLMSGGGKLLWSISAGNSTDCVVNVYDEGADPTESRFQRAPEYRELFSEIFSVLKRSVARSSQAEAAAAAERAQNGASAEAKKESSAAASAEKKKSKDEPLVCGQAEEGDAEAGKIEEVTIKSTDAVSPSSILSLAMQRKSRKAKGRKERKAEQLRRKVLSLSPERFNQEAKKATAETASEVEQAIQPPQQRDQSPALSERSDRSSKKGGRHWAKRGRPLPLMGGGSNWPWSAPRPWNGGQQVPSPLAVTPACTSQQQPQQRHQPPPPAPGTSSSSNEHKPIAFTSSASADVARLKRLEKSYAEALRTSLPKPHRSRK